MFFIVPIVQQVALDNMPLSNGTSSEKFSERPMFIFFTVKNDHNHPNKVIDFTDRRLLNFIFISPQSGQFYIINVLENQWMSLTFRGLISIRKIPTKIYIFLVILHILIIFLISKMYFCNSIIILNGATTYLI